MDEPESDVQENAAEVQRAEQLQKDLQVSETAVKAKKSKKVWIPIIVAASVLLIAGATTLAVILVKQANERSKRVQEARTAITEARDTVQDALDYGVLALDLTAAEGSLTEAETVVDKEPQKAKELAEEANGIAKDAKEAAKINALAMVNQAILEAEGAIAAVTNGADLTQANSSLTNAKALRDSAGTLAELIGDNNSALTYARQAGAEAQAAYAAKEQADAAAVAAAKEAERQACLNAMWAWIRANTYGYESIISLTLVQYDGRTARGHVEYPGDQGWVIWAEKINGRWVITDQTYI